MVHVTVIIHANVQGRDVALQKLLCMPWNIDDDNVYLQHTGAQRRQQRLPAACPEYYTNYIVHSTLYMSFFTKVQFFLVTSQLRVMKQQLAKPSESQVSCVA